MLRIISALLAGLLLCAQTPMLPGFPPGTFQNRAALDAGGGLGPATVTYRTRAQVNTSAGTTNGQATGLNIVNAGADLLLIGALTCQNPGGFASATMTPSVGSSTAVIANVATMAASIFTFAVPNGTNLTSATIDIVYTNNTSDNCSVAFWTVPQASLSSMTAVDSKSAAGSTTAPAVTTLVTSAGGIMVAAAVQSGFETATWTGSPDTPTEDYDSFFPGAADHTGASFSNTSASAGATVTATFTGSAANARIVAASWR